MYIIAKQLTAAVDMLHEDKENTKKRLHKKKKTSSAPASCTTDGGEAKENNF